MTTHSSVRNRIKRNTFIIESDTKYDSRIDDCILTTIRQKEHDKWWFLERVGTLALSVGSDSAALPSDCGSVNRIDIIKNTDRYTLQDLTYSQLTTRYYTSSPIKTYTPEAYALLNRTLYFSHIADVDYSLPIIYYAYDATLPSGDNDTSIWYEREGIDLIVAQATYLFDLTVMQNPNANNTAATIALETLKEQHRKHRRV
jgi:hypothetical protein